MNRFVESVGSLTERGGGQQAERSGDHGGFVGQDVAEHVLGEQHVERRGTPDQVHRGGVDEHVLELHLRKLLAQHALDDCSPQPGRLQDVRLVHGNDTPATTHGQATGDLCHAFDFVGGVGADVLGLVRCAALPAEVDPAGQFPHDHDVRASDHLGLERRGVEHRLHGAHRAQVRKHAESAAQFQQSLFGAYPGTWVRPLRTTYGAEQRGSALAARIDRAGRQGRSRRVDRGATDQGFCEFEVVTVLRAHGLQHPDGLGRDLGADAIAAEDCDARLHAPSRARSKRSIASIWLSRYPSSSMPFIRQ